MAGSGALAAKILNKSPPANRLGAKKASGLRADLLAKTATDRAEEASFIFHKYNTSARGEKQGLDVDALLRCFIELGFSNGRQNRSDEEMRTWAGKELKRGNKKGDGKLSYEEFVDYYNKFIVGHRRKFEETYELGLQIGKGAFGFVFKAKRIGGITVSPDPLYTVGAMAAVKQIQKKSEVPMELLHNEITIWEQLKHPNLVRLLDVFETDERIYLVTELMRGGESQH